MQKCPRQEELQEGPEKGPFAKLHPGKCDYYSFHEGCYANVFSVQIPDQKCREYPIKLPKKIPKEECHTHPREECKKIPKQVPRQVAEKVPRYYCDDHHETLEHLPGRVTRYYLKILRIFAD